MDITSIVGPIIAIGLILIGFGLEGGNLAQMFAPTSLIIVVGGSLGAMLVAYSTSDILNSFKAIGTWMKQAAYTADGTKKILVEIAQNRSNPEHLSKIKSTYANQEDIHFFISMIEDGYTFKQIEQALKQRKTILKNKHTIIIKFWEDLGGLTPTIGIIGAVLGLIQAMSVIDEPQLVGHGIAVAFTATLYGVALANLIFLPISNKLKTKFKSQHTQIDIIHSAIENFENNDSPDTIDEKLSLIVSG